MNPIAKTLIFVGLILVISGLFWQVGSNFLGLGKLPGDIVVEKENFKFYFPLATSIVISVILSLLAYIFRSIGK